MKAAVSAATVTLLADGAAPRVFTDPNEAMRELVKVEPTGVYALLATENGPIACVNSPREEMQRRIAANGHAARGAS